MHEAFFASLKAVVGATIIDDSGDLAAYCMDTGGAERYPAGAVRVTEVAAVPSILREANAHGVPLWPISGGRNFGYGTAQPVLAGSVIVDLSPLRRVEIDSEAAIARIQPGVTQHDLAAAIRRAGAKLLVPTTGVGPNGNILGNALDGGYGLTPITDHFEAVAEVEGYWANGTPFRHIYRELNCGDLAERWRFGTGAYWGGLLRQSGFGIVTQATVQLARVPEDCRILIFEWASDAAFEAAQPTLSRLVEEIPGIGGVIMMNGQRILATQPDAPLATTRRGSERAAHLEAEVQRRRISCWTGLGTLYGSSRSVRGAVHDIRERLRACRVWSFRTGDVRRLQRIFRVLPGSWFPSLRRHLGALVNALGTVEGVPITAFLRIAYALEGTPRPLDVASNPARDGQGILWYAPLLPFTPQAVRRYREIIGEVLARHGFDPLLAVTSRSPRVLSATIPLLFDPAQADEVARARRCYRDLVDTGLRMGWPPYRLGVDYMDQIAVGEESGSAALVRGLKSLLDPNGVMAPGRYTVVRPQE